MRRDLIIGILISVLFHGGVAGVGEIFKGGAKKVKPKEEEKFIQIEMPKLEPDEPERFDNEDAPAPVVDFAPPMQVDVPQVPQPTSFVQALQPPPPDSLKPNTGVINIPKNRLEGSNLGEVFDISKLDQVPVATVQVQPNYPYEMRREGLNGEVLVRFIVDTNGEVREPYVIKSSRREFEDAAVAAVSKWKFKPGKKRGRAVNTGNVQVPIIFNIADAD